MEWDKDIKIGGLSGGLNGNFSPLGPNDVRLSMTQEKRGGRKIDTVRITISNALCKLVGWDKSDPVSFRCNRVERVIWIYRVTQTRRAVDNAMPLKLQRSSSENSPLSLYINPNGINPEDWRNVLCGLAKAETWCTGAVHDGGVLVRLA